MKQIAIEELIKFITVIAGSSVTVIKVAQGYFKMKEKEFMENSVGVTKIKELVEMDVQLKRDIEHLETISNTNKEDVQKVQREQHEFANKVWDYMTRRN